MEEKIARRRRRRMHWTFDGRKLFKLQRPADEMQAIPKIATNSNDAR